MSAESQMLTVLLVVLWLTAGYLPTRVIKHFFVTEYGDSLGAGAWDRGDAVRCIWVTLLGPFGGLTALFVRWGWGARSTPWGWMW